jgi:hypothetical protein
MQATMRQSLFPLLLLLAGILVAAPSVSASSSGCTTAPRGISCIDVHGSKLHVDTVRATRGKYSSDFICNYSARVFFQEPDGTIVTRDSGVVHNGACSTPYAWIDFHINANFPNGTKVCTAFYESGQQQGGKPCEKIHS